MTRDHAEPICPLCRNSDAMLFDRDHREYFRCSKCHLVFVPPLYFLSPDEERAVYDHHENSAQDLAYRHFLGRLFEPVSERLAPHSQGLDFGSGPGPTLSVMFEEAGHSMKLYDPFYAPEVKPLQQEYDFITASEVVEHLHHPQRELDRLWACVKPNGLLGIMTKRVIDQKTFARWHYKNDPTHVSFFSIETFHWLAGVWHATLSVYGTDVVLFTKRR